MFKDKSKLPSSSNWGKVLLSRLHVNPGLFLSADLSSFVPHKWTHLIDFLSTWITSIAVNMGRQIPLLPSQWSRRRMEVAAGGAQHEHNGGCCTLLTNPCAFPQDSAELPASQHFPQRSWGRQHGPTWRLWACGTGTWGLASPSSGRRTAPVTLISPTSAFPCASDCSSSVTPPHLHPRHFAHSIPTPTDLLTEQATHTPTSGP